MDWKLSKCQNVVVETIRMISNATVSSANSESGVDRADTEGFERDDESI